MATATTTPQTQPQPAASSTALDPQIVGLAKAIRQYESGNHPVPGKTGELPSRYQYEPATWSAAAKEYLGNAKAPLTLQNENYVSYQRIKAWKDAGMNPAQIASMWNSGNPDPNNNPKTAEYVQAVYRLYQQFKSPSGTATPEQTPVTQNTTMQPAPQPTQNTFSTALSNIASGNTQANAQESIGATKQLLSDVSSAGAQNTPMGKQFVSDFAAKGNVWAQGVQSFSKAMQPSNLEQTKGAVSTSLGEGLMPYGELTKAPGKLVEAVGQKVGEHFIPTSAKEAALLQNYKAGTSFLQRVGITSGGVKKPVTAAATAFYKGLVGTETRIGVKAKQAATKLWRGLIAPALKQSQATVDIPSFFGEVEQKIIQSEPELSRQKDLLKAFSALKDDYEGVENVSIAQLQKFKEGWARFVPQKAYKGEDISGLLSNVKNIAAGVARSKIYDALGNNVKQAYFDYGNLQALQELGQKAMTGGKLKGGFGGFASGLWEMATVPIGTIAGQTIYKVGQGIEILGLPLAKTLGSALGVTNTADQTPSASTQQQPQATTTPPTFQQSMQ